MRSSIQYYFDIAAKVANAKSDGRSFKLAAVGIRSDGVIVASANSPCHTPYRQAHSEYRVAAKLNYGSVVYVARLLRRDNSFAIARPCPDCMKVLASKKVKQAFYTISPNEYGCVNPMTGEDRYYLCR